MKPKKITFLSGDMNRPGGTERVTAVVASALAELGHEVSLLSVQGGLAPFFPLHESICLEQLFAGPNNYRRKYLQAVWRLRRSLARRRPEVVIDVESLLALFSLPAMAGLGIRHICWEHFNFRTDHGRRGRRLARFLAARCCDAVVTLTERDRALWQSAGGRAAIRAIPNPLSFPVQKSHAYPLHSTTILAVGRPAHIKGYDRLIEAWARICQLAPEWTLEIVGLGERDRDELDRQCRSSGIAGRVRLEPATPDIHAHYRGAAIFCLSSRSEGFPMVLLESLAFGLPVVSFDCETGPAEILEGCGVQLVANGDVEAFAANLLQLIRDPGRRAELSRLASRKAEQYSPGLIRQQWLELLEC